MEFKAQVIATMLKMVPDMEFFDIDLRELISEMPDASAVDVAKAFVATGKWR